MRSCVRSRTGTAGGARKTRRVVTLSRVGGVVQGLFLLLLTSPGGCGVSVGHDERPSGRTRHAKAPQIVEKAVCHRSALWSSTPQYTFGPRYFSWCVGVMARSRDGNRRWFAGSRAECGDRLVVRGSSQWEGPDSPWRYDWEMLSFISTSSTQPGKCRVNAPLMT